ncbi:hypothetical protein KY330_03150 [Candidatus Woesearchaeota archaeon]|nr:hypothetical protein [Candidatus Woesearchaeota archaeon]
MVKVSVIGAGPWGTAVACLLKHNGNDVSLWAYQNILDKDIVPIDGISVTDDINSATQESEFIFLVLNSQFFIPTLNQMNFEDCINRSVKFVVLTKGLVQYNDRFYLSMEILSEKYNVPKENIIVLSGPNIANEIYIGNPAATMVGSVNLEAANKVKNLLSSDRFRVYVNRDPKGLQWCGILKNPYAIGVGLFAGLYKGFDNNVVSWYISEALREMQLIGEFFGAERATFFDVAGIGDLITTCFAGRNRKVGEMLNSKNLEDIYSYFAPQKPEGPEQLRIVYSLVKDNLDVPLFKGLYEVLYEGKNPNSYLSEVIGS